MINSIKKKKLIKANLSLPPPPTWSIKFFLNLLVALNNNPAS